jgi:hypothetical protein
MAKATIRVRSASDAVGQRPGRAEMERTAELLQQGGFEVLRVGRFGVNVQGDEQSFQRELGVNVQGAENLVETPHPQHEELSKLIDLVEVAGKPESFDKA